MIRIENEGIQVMDVTGIKFDAFDRAKTTLESLDYDIEKPIYVHNFSDSLENVFSNVESTILSKLDIKITNYLKSFSYTLLNRYPTHKYKITDSEKEIGFDDSRRLPFVGSEIFFKALSVYINFRNNIWEKVVMLENMRVYDDILGFNSPWSEEEGGINGNPYVSFCKDMSYAYKECNDTIEALGLDRQLFLISKQITNDNILGKLIRGRISKFVLKNNGTSLEIYDGVEKLMLLNMLK